MSSEVVLKVENIGKRYEIYEAPHYRLFQTLLRGRKQFYKEFWALKDVSFEVKKGECLGIIGRNGAAKVRSFRSSPELLRRQPGASV